MNRRNFIHSTCLPLGSVIISDYLLAFAAVPKQQLNGVTETFNRD